MKKKKLTIALALIMAAMMAAEVSAAPAGIEIGTPVEDPAIVSVYEDGIADDVTDLSSVSENVLTPEATYTDSGTREVAKMSKNLIANTYNTVYNTKYPFYTTKPSTVAPFSLGKVDDLHMAYALGSVNFMRQLGGLPRVEFDDTYNSYAQHGAVLLAGCGVFDHTNLPCPAGMDSTFYRNGLTGTSQSNISYGGGENFSMADFTIGYMQDYSAKNATIVGHRRWVLNPEMAKTGFGYAASKSGNTYSAMYAFDHSAAAVDYDFIAWPSSGNFPNNLMGAGEPWSVSLNPAKFNVSSGFNTSAVTITVTAPNGNTKTFTHADTTADPGDRKKPFYIIDTRGYGISNCIIFRPGTDTFGSNNLNGTYTITISGLKDKVGVPTTICYSVEFFNIDDYKTGVINVNDINKKIDATEVENFVKRLYAKCMGREADASGLLYWKDLLLTGKKTGSEVAQGFFFSEELQNRNLSDEAFVETLYEVMMGRASDAGGKTDWVYKLKNGVTREGVFRGFCESAEFGNICKKYGITRGTIKLGQARDVNPSLTTFVARLYTKALGRAYEVDGLNTWCKRINNKEWTLDNVSTTGFFHSPEFINRKLNNSDYVKVLYQTFFDREADQSGYNYWMGRMAAGSTRDDVLKGFANSAEFTNLKKSFGL